MGRNALAAIAALTLSGCTAETVSLTKELVSFAISLRPTPSPTLSPAPTASPASTIEPPKKPEGEGSDKPQAVITPGPPPPCGKRPAEDGFKRNFTWKPNSDTQKWAVAVLPPGVPGECRIAGLKARYKGDIGGYDGTEPRAVMILDGWTGERLEQEHSRIIVRCGCWNWSIPKPSKRHD